MSRNVTDSATAVAAPRRQSAHGTHGLANLPDLTGTTPQSTATTVDPALLAEFNAKNKAASRAYYAEPRFHARSKQ